MLKGCLQREVLSSQRDTWRKANQCIQVAAGEVLSCYKKEILHSEISHSLEQPPLRCGGVLITGGFKKAMGCVARQSHLGFLYYEMLEQMIF